MTGFESQEEDVPPRVLFYKPMSWLGQVRSHHRDESWPATLWQTFFSVSLDDPIPVIAKKPFAVCGWRKFQIDTLDDHLGTCTTHSGVKKAHDWVVDQLADLFRRTFRSAFGICHVNYEEKWWLSISSLNITRNYGCKGARRFIHGVKTSAVHLIFNIDGSTIISKSHTHPSHSQASRLLTSSLSLGVPVPRATQCMWDM
jgi:hypothetical protein